MAPTTAPQQGPPPPSANDVASELLRQGELMKKQYAAMSAQIRKTARPASPVHPNGPASEKPEGNNGHGALTPLSGPSSHLSSTSQSSIGHHALDNVAAQHARRALHKLHAQESPVPAVATAVKKALDEQNADQFKAMSTPQVESFKASDASLSPVAEAANDAQHLDRLEQLIGRLHKRTNKESSEAAKVVNTPPPTPPPPSDKAREVERRSRAGLESFIHDADDVVKEEQFEEMKAKQDTKERVRRSEEMKLSLRDLGKHPVNTDLSSALDAAMTSESMSMPGSFILR